MGRCRRSVTSWQSRGPTADLDAAAITELLVRRLLSEQFPQWSTLPVRRVLDGGNDHRMFRLGDSLCVRLPSAPGYVPTSTGHRVRGCTAGSVAGR
jgi:hypothetical protein